MKQNWRNVAERVHGQRTALRLTQEQLAAEAKVGTSTVRKLETAAADNYQASSLAAVSTALWGHGDAIERILRGEDPVGTEDEPAATLETIDVRLARIEALLLDSASRRGDVPRGPRRGPRDGDVR